MARRFPLTPGLKMLGADLGVDPARLLRRAGLPADALDRDDMTVTPSEYYRLCRVFEEEAGRPDLALVVGKAIANGAMSPALYAAQCSPNLATAAERLARYKELVGPFVMTATWSGETLRIETRPQQAHEAPPRSLLAAELVFILALARHATRTVIEPLSVELAGDDPAADTVAAYFGVEPVRGDSFAISFARDDALRPFLTQDEAMWRTFEPELRRRLESLSREGILSARLTSVLLELIPADRATIDEAASRLAMSSRTLQRKLREEGETFQSVLSRTREGLAARYLEDPSLTTAEIAFLLGYRDTNSFYRAYHAWTGTTARSTRSELAQA